MTRFLIITGGVALVLVVIILSMSGSTPPIGPSAVAPRNQPPAGNTNQPATIVDKIEVASPLPNQKVASPLTVTGKARGSWYFEASFPVELKDAKGNVLVQTPAQAQSEWTTLDFVPFKVTLTFSRPSTRTGVLILKRDNPSGLPQNDEQLQVPVAF